MNNQRLKLNREFYRYNLLANKLSPNASGISDEQMSRVHRTQHNQLQKRRELDKLLKSVDLNHGKQD